MAKDQATKAVVDASISLVSKLTMITAALDAQTIEMPEFWEAYSEAIESFIPEGTSGGDQSPTPAPAAAQEVRAGAA